MNATKPSAKRTEKRGGWLTPAEAAPRLGMTYREVLNACQDRLLDHQRRESPGGRTRYLIHEDAISGYLRRHTIRAVA